MLNTQRGTRDFLPEEMEARRKVEKNLREVARRWGYREVCTPEFEDLELFTKKSGEGVINEIYNFQDKGGRELALRPEITAPVIRMYVNNEMTLLKPIRWFYFGDCFRYERPQKGRYRQFWQFGLELIGADTPSAYAESIVLAVDLLKKTKVKYELKIGHLAFMKSILRDLTPDEQRKIMSLLDKKNLEELDSYLVNKWDQKDKLLKLLTCKTIQEAFDIVGEIEEKSKIEQFFSLLDQEKINYTLNLGIARGLDYYTGMVFEAYAEKLGAENQILGGGVYRLAHLFGGQDVVCCGFAIGFDRVLVAQGYFLDEPDYQNLSEKINKNRKVVSILSMDDGKTKAFSIAHQLRKELSPSWIIELNITERKLGKQLEYAAKTSRFVVIIGRQECESGLVTLKDLKTGEQVSIPLEIAIGKINNSKKSKNNPMGQLSNKELSNGTR
jgi:histidyl-tRNA synthetase